ncbi:MAG: circadian clock protein KaiA, partial [Chloroflexaceae bacterium]|nr:circadian clock protein KaiA [Chloroflexaceae bacterium]
MYYKRNPGEFYRNLSARERQALLTALKTQYRQVILDYFAHARTGR